MPANKKSSVDSKFSNERLPVMDKLLRNGRVVDSPEEFVRMICREFPSSRKISKYTFDKDLRILRDLVEEKSKGKVTIIYKRDLGYRYTDESFSLFPEVLDDEEHYLLETAATLMQVFKGTSLEAQCVKIFKRIMSSMPGKKDYFNHEQDRFIELTTKSKESNGKWIERILKSILLKECLDMQYLNSKGQLGKKIISPYALKHYQGKWYFVAHDQLCERKEKTNVYSIEGIQHLSYSNKKYFTDDFQVEYYFKYCLGIWHQHQKEPVEVQLEFSAARKDYLLSNPLHPTQVAEYDEERKILKVSITVYNTPELEMMILSFGSSVRVISPKEVAERVKEQLRFALQSYS